MSSSSAIKHMQIVDQHNFVDVIDARSIESLIRFYSSKDAGASEFDALLL